MNRLGGNFSGGEAELRYLDSDYKVIKPGAFVRCAVTGAPIPLEELKYWSVALQEPYIDAATSLARHQDIAKTK